eukprot:11677840-Prorocentrum_lima.AAC.1
MTTTLMDAAGDKWGADTIKFAILGFTSCSMQAGKPNLNNWCKLRFDLWLSRKRMSLPSQWMAIPEFMTYALQA